MTAAFQIEHFHGVVAEGSNVQSLRGCVDRKMIDSSLDARKIDRSRESQWLLRGGPLDRGERNDGGR